MNPPSPNLREACPDVALALSATRLDRMQTELQHGRPVVMQTAGPAAPAVMLAAVLFGLGTLPNLLAAGWLVGRARPWLAHSAVRLAAAALLAGFAGVGIWRALWGPLSVAQGPFCLVH